MTTIKQRFQNWLAPPVEQKKGTFTISTDPTQIIPAQIETLKNAIHGATGKYNQDRITLYDMYQNAIDFDPVLASLIQQRLLATAGKKLEYTVNDIPAEEGKRITDAPKFSEFVEQLIISRVFWGMGLVELKPGSWFDFAAIPIKHIDPYRRVVMKLQNQQSNDDESYADRPDVYFIGEADNFGLLSQAVIPAIYKRSAMNNWSNYVRLAGNNFERIIYRGGIIDPSRRAEVLKAIQSRQGRAMDFPEDIEYKVENLSSSQQNALFKEHTEYLDEMMTRLILGQTMTTQDGSSRSQAEVHERTQETIFDADAKFVLDVLNFDVYEQLIAMYNLPAGGRWQYVENAGTKQLQQVELDLKLKELGVVFTDQELRQKYGL